MAKDLINREVWGMLSPEDQAECMSHLPSSDIVQTTHEEGDTTTIELKLIDTFFEKNISLQEDMRTFQVSHTPIYLTNLFTRKIWKTVALNRYTLRKLHWHDKNG